MTSPDLQYEEETISLEKDQENNWTLSGGRGFPLDQSYPDAMVQALKEIQAAKTIENVEDLSEVWPGECCLLHYSPGREGIPVGHIGKPGWGDSGIFLLGTAMFTWWTPPCWLLFALGLYDIVEKETIPLHDRPARGTDHHQRGHAGDGIPGGQRPGNSDQYTWF